MADGPLIAAPPKSLSLLRFVICVLLNVLSLGVGVGIFMVEGPGCPIATIWMWVFAFPFMFAVLLQWDVAGPLLWLNPLIYGLVWWLVWRVFTTRRHQQ